MKAECRLYLNGRYWEFSRRRELPYPDDQHWAVSTVHYCQFCCRVWAWLEVEGSTQCVCESAACEDCLEKWQSHAMEDYYFAGSILNGLYRHSDYDRGLLDSLPHELLVREFRVHLRAYAKELEPYGPVDRVDQRPAELFSCAPSDSDHSYNSTRAVSPPRSECPT